MKLKNFIGKVVVSARTGERYLLYLITAPCIEVVAEKPNTHGRRVHRCWNTIHGDPISKGDLFFENPKLTIPFQKAYDAHCRSRNGYWEDYGYWMRRD